MKNIKFLNFVMFLLLLLGLLSCGDSTINSVGGVPGNSSSMGGNPDTGTGSTPGDNNEIGDAGSDDSETGSEALDKWAVMEKIKSYAVLQDNPAPFFHFNYDDTLLLEPGQSVQLQLLDGSNEEVKDARWFVIRNFPMDGAFDLKETQQDSEESLVHISDDYTVTAKTYNSYWPTYERRGHIVAVCGEYIHKIPFEILTSQKIKTRERNRQVDEKVQSIVHNMVHLSDAEKVFYINNYVVDTLTYDPAYEGRPQDYYTFIENRAVCDGYASMFLRLAKEVGLKVTKIIGDSNQGLHAWNAVYVNDEVYFLDTTWGEKGDGRTYRYFLIPRNIFTEDHESKPEYHSEIKGQEYLFYSFKREELYSETVPDLQEVLDKIADSLPQAGKDLDIIVPKSVNRITLALWLKNSNSHIKTVWLEDDYKKKNYNNHYIIRAVITPESYESDVHADITLKESANIKKSVIDINLDSPLELAKHNIEVKNSKLESIVKKSNSHYEITVAEVSGDNVSIKINKTGTNVSVFPEELGIEKVKSEKPHAGFIGISPHGGKLVNIDANTEYNIGNGEWIRATSDTAVIKQVNFLRDILLRRVEPGKLSSDYQKIKFRKQSSAPNWIEVEYTPTGNLVKKLSTKMEYQRVGDVQWHQVEQNTMENLPQGQYRFRLKGREGVLASEEYEVEIH